MKRPGGSERNQSRVLQEGDSKALKDFVWEKDTSSQIFVKFIQFHSYDKTILRIKSNYIMAQLTNILNKKLFPNKTSLVSVG